MSKDYSNFSAVDFAEEPFFKEWVCENSVEAAEFWTSFMAIHPGKTKAMEEAWDVIILMKGLPERELTMKMTEQANTIKGNIDKAIPYPFLHSGKFMGRPVVAKPAGSFKILSSKNMGIAATLLIGIVSLVAFTVLKFEKDISLMQTQTVVQTTPEGKRSLINLPDGSKVWLNAESQLVYSKDFLAGDTREVFLTGEGFFDVAEDESKPFIVSTSSIVIKVLGAQFNVQSYDNDKTIETTLEKGKIAISMINVEGYTEGREMTTILPNQRAVFIKQSKKLILQNNVEAKVFSDWRSGKLYFEDTPITEVLAMIERWYGVTIHLEHIPPAKCTFSAKIETEKLSEVLDLFKASTVDSIGYVIKDKDVYISGKLCE